MSIRMGWHALRMLCLVLGVAVLQGCQTELYSGLDEHQANQMISALMQQGIQAQRQAAKNGTMSVLVEDDYFANAVQILEAAGLPQAHFASLGEVFKGNGLVSSPTQERAQFVYAMSQELSNTVSQVDGIRTARVHVDLPEAGLKGKDIQTASAAVFVRYDGDVDIGPLIPKIKSLVAGSISELTYENVSVVPVAATVERVQDPIRMTRWLGILVPEQSLNRLIQLSILALLVVAAATGAGSWWFATRASRGARIYRQTL